VAEAEPLQWSAPENFEQMQRGTLSILRREVMTCPAAQFVDFVMRWQHVHPATQVALPEGLPAVLHRLQGFTLPTELWEQAILPMRCRGYQPRRLDDLIAAGQWTWHCRQGTEDGAAELSFVERDALSQLPPPTLIGEELGAAATAIVETLRARGASFTVEI